MHFFHVHICSAFAFFLPVLCAPLIHRRGGSLSVSTSLGTVTGASDAGAVRFTLPFAQPPLGDLRFANPQPVGPFNGTYDATKTPSACYQAVDEARGGNTPSEDCLYLNIFRPATASLSAKLPVMVWIHGGSFIGGSSTAAGLDGSYLAASQNVIVVTLQYRLGLFGFLQTSDTVDEKAGGAPGSPKVAGNQATRDVVAALGYVSAHIGSFGGDKSSVTIFGQSSGAHMIRALLTTPAAAPYFARAILHSDTSDYGEGTADISNELGSYALQQLNCSDIACVRGKSADDVISAEYSAYSNVPAQNPSVPSGEPWRPVLGSYVTSALEQDAANGQGVPGNKPVIITTVQNEAGSVIGANFEAAPPNSTRMPEWYDNSTSLGIQDVMNGFFGTDRSATLCESSTYACDNATAVDDGIRQRAEVIATDGLWRCAAQTEARNLAGAESKVWLAQWDLGVTYASNTYNDYCAENGAVCHEDDIYPVFGTYPSSASKAQRSLSTEVQARWASFARTGSPNPSSGNYAKWSPVASATQLNVLHFGAAQLGKPALQDTQRPQACGTKGTGLWGSTVQFDWQLYN